MEPIYREHRHAMVRVAWLILRDHQLAEDAVHAAVTRLLRKDEPPENDRAYVLKAVRNAAIDIKRSEQRTAGERCEYDHASGVSAGAMGELQEIISSLDECKREVIQMRLQIGLTFKEIADLLAQPISTISSRYQRAIEEVREKWGSNDE